MTLGKRWPLWAVVLGTALLTALFTVGFEQGITALRRPPVLPAATPTSLQPVVVQLEAPEPEPAPSVLPDDEMERQLQQLQQQAAQHQATTFVLKAERQVSFALEALAINDMARADRELVAAKASLDEAFRLVAEDLKPQIENERVEIGRMRADLDINPMGLDEDLRRLRARLMDLISAQPEG